MPMTHKEMQDFCLFSLRTLITMARQIQITHQEEKKRLVPHYWMFDYHTVHFKSVRHTGQTGAVMMLSTCSEVKRMLYIQSDKNIRYLMAEQGLHDRHKVDMMSMEDAYSHLDDKGPDYDVIVIDNIQRERDRTVVDLPILHKLQKLCMVDNSNLVIIYLD